MTVPLELNQIDSNQTKKSKAYKQKQLAHSSKDVWSTIARLLKDHTDTNILQVNCGLSYLVDYLYDVKDFKNVRGIDVRQDLIAKYKEANPQKSDLVSAENFFRSSDDNHKIEQFDIYIFSSCLEYYDDPSIFLDRIPKGKMLVICYPNFDDGLVCSFFDSKNDMRIYFEKYIDKIEIHESVLYSIPEFLIDQKMFILVGIKK